MSISPTKGRVSPIAKASSTVMGCTLRDTGLANLVSVFRTITGTSVFASTLEYQARLNSISTPERSFRNEKIQNSRIQGVTDPILLI